MIKKDASDCSNSSTQAVEFAVDTGKENQWTRQNPTDGKPVTKGIDQQATEVANAGLKADGGIGRRRNNYTRNREEEAGCCSKLSG